MIYAVYDVGTGEIDRVIDAPEFMRDRISLMGSQAIAEVDMMVYSDKYHIKDGVLTPKTIADQPS